MKKIIVLIAFFTSCIYAENFDFQIKGDSSFIDTDIVNTSFYGTLKNSSGNKLQVKVIKINGNEQWLSTICVGEQCFGPLTDTVPHQLQVDEEIEIKLNIDCNVVTNGNIYIKVQNYNDPSDTVLLTFHADFKKSGSSVDDVEIVPSTLELSAYPNPFNPVTTLSFSIAESGMASLKVYDVKGNQVAILKEGYVNKGKQIVGFNASTLATGVYFAKLSTNNKTMVKKLIFLK